MDGTADDRFFEWLYSHIGPVVYNNPRHTHWKMMRQLYQIEFRAFILNDSNRAEDGMALREEFINQWGPEGINEEWMDLPCSLFEMLIALAGRAAFESYGSTGDWFWKFMENLGLDRYTDHVYNNHVAQDINDVAERVIQRHYSHDGTGGLFPLRSPQNDQRSVELWYQLQAYLIEGLNGVANGPRV